MTNLLGYGYRSRRWHRLPALSKIGWRIATSGDSRPFTVTAVGFGLYGAGFVLRRKTRRKILYRGNIQPGSATHIKVYEGHRAVYDAALRS